jgi:hypothetical protein
VSEANTARRERASALQTRVPTSSTEKSRAPQQPTLVLAAQLGHYVCGRYSRHGATRSLAPYGRVSRVEPLDLRSETHKCTTWTCRVNPISFDIHLRNHLRNLISTYQLGYSILGYVS